MYQASAERYSEMKYRRCGKSGLMLPAISLGLWQNFGSVNVMENCIDMIHTAFDLGITHFDLANNYGPIPGSAEENFGRIMAKDMAPYRDEMIISSKAGYTMWPGPYGDWGSRKYLIASCDQSLKRMGLVYVDIFYHHRPDPNTPLEESMGALDSIVRSGKALYAGISNYPAPEAEKAIAILRQLGTPCLIHQPRYNMFDRHHEQEGLFEVLGNNGVGCITFSPLAQGLLSDKYLNGIPANSRANTKRTLSAKDLTPELLEKIRALNGIAAERGQTLAQMAIAWNLRVPELTSALIGASSSAQIREIAGCLKHTEFSAEELRRIDGILNS